MQLGAAPCPSEGPAPLAKELCAWKPTDGDSTMDIEDRIDRWTAFWNPYLPKPVTEARPGAKP